MELTVNRPVTLSVSAIEVVAPIRHGTEDMPNDAPGRTGDVWRCVVDIDTGRIRDWPGGELSFYMKVVDGGVYRLLDDRGKVVGEREQDYVPRCIPGEYGDYIEFAIAADGTIAKWAHYCTPDRIRDSFFAQD